MKKIRVLHLVPWIASGGVERRRLTLSRHLGCSEFEQQIVSIEILTSLGEELESAGTNITTIGGDWSFRDLRSLYRIRGIIRDWQPHIVHGAVYEGIVMAGFLAHPPRHQTIVEETDVAGARRFGGHALLGLAAHRASRCVGVSRTVGDYFRQTLLVPERRVRVIMNGIEPPRMVRDREIEALRGSLGIPTGAPIVGCVGRIFDGHKRQSDLIRALVGLRSNGATSPHLIVVGSGPDLDMLRQLSRRLDVHERTHFLGYQGDTAPYFRLMDVYALVSNREACPLSLMEAMLHERPVVTTAIGGGAELVENDITGLHAPVGDVDAIRRTLQRLIDDAELRRRLSKAAHAKAEKEFTARRYAREVADLYRELAAV
jgi:L-malate glycosyltransferase